MADRPTWDETWLALAQLMAARSLCPTGAGCVIVDKQQRVVATGYAGPPATYDSRAGALASPPSQTFTDCRRYCARARLDPNDRDPRYHDCPSAHAETNAFAFSDRSRVEGGTLYVSSAVCRTCVAAVGNSGVTRVVWPDGNQHAYRANDDVIAYLVRCRIQVDLFRSEA